MALLDRVRGELRKKEVKLWLPPYTPPEAGALTQLASSFAPGLDVEIEAVVNQLEDLRLRALAKLKQKTQVTLLGRVLGGAKSSASELRVEVDAADGGAAVRKEVLRRLGSTQAGAVVRVIAGGRALQDGSTLAEQGWQCDQERGGQPLRVLIIISGAGASASAEAAAPAEASAPAQLASEASPAAAGEVPAEAPRASARSVELIRAAAEKLTAEGFGDFELSDAATGQLVPVAPAARQALVTAVALHARGREVLNSREERAAEEALEWLVEADQCFERCRAGGAAQLLDKLQNFGQLQLDICWAYALLGDTDRLPDAEARLQVAESMVRRQVDKNFLTLAEVKAEQGHTLPPEVLPSVRLWLLRGIARNVRGHPGAREDLQRAQLFMQGLRVNDDDVTRLLALGVTRVQAVAALRRSGGSADSAAADLLSAASHREAAKRKREVQKNMGQTDDGSFVDPEAVDQLVAMGQKKKDAVKALKKANNDVHAALDALLTKTSGEFEVDDVALASLMSMGFERDQSEAALRATGDIEAAVLRLTSGEPLATQGGAKAPATASAPAAEDEERAAKAQRAQQEQEAAMDEAREIVERELGQCLRKNDMEDEAAGDMLEEEEALLQRHLSSL